MWPLSVSGAVLAVQAQPWLVSTKATRPYNLAGKVERLLMPCRTTVCAGKDQPTGVCRLTDRPDEVFARTQAISDTVVAARDSPAPVNLRTLVQLRPPSLVARMTLPGGLL